MGGSGRAAGFWAYRETLRLPGAYGFCVPGALARLPQAMLGLGAVLLLSGLHRSFTLAGLVAGAVALSQGVASPLVSRVVDRRGQHVVLLPLLLAHGLFLALLVLAAQRGASGGLLVGVGVLAGLSMPQFSACSRARWTYLLADDDTRIHTALSIESLIDEAVFIVGPVLVAALATSVAPPAGLLAAIVLVLVFGVMFLAQRGTEPPPHPTESELGTHAIRHRGLVVLVGVFLMIGVLFGLVEVGIAALAREQGHAGVAGLLLGLWAAGSLVSGTAYGAIRWHTGPTRRLLVGAWAMAAGSVLIGIASGGLVTVTAALVLAGLANAPTLITGNTLVRSVVPASTLTEAYTWLGVSVFAGIALGAPLGGVLTDQLRASASLWVSAAAGAGAGTVATLGRFSLDSHHGDPLARPPISRPEA